MAKGKATKKKATVWKDNAVVRYLRDTRAELRKVSWPTREEAWSLTKVVLAVTVSMALLLGLLDYLFSLELGGIIQGSPVAIGILVIVMAAGVLATAILRRQTVR